MDIIEVRGVPLAMKLDGWWLSDDTDRPLKRTIVCDGPWLRAILLLAMIALADVLLRQVSAGVSLAIFAVSMVTAALIVIEPQMKRRRVAICSMTTFLSVLPIVELVQPLSIIILAVGIALTLAMIAGLADRWYG